MFKEINAKFPALPFTFRELETEKASSHRMGIKECLNHGLLHPYPVLYEKSGELVAQFKATVLLMPNGSDRCVITICGKKTFYLQKSLHFPVGATAACRGCATLLSVNTPTRSYV